jgi:hypothetical protein
VSESKKINPDFRTNPKDYSKVESRVMSVLRKKVVYSPLDLEKRTTSVYGTKAKGCE